MALMSRLIALSAFAVLAQSGLAQSPYGSIEFRWRERALGLVAPGGYFLPAVAGAFSGPALNGVSNPTSTIDARFVFILEARVTRAAGNADLGGLAGMALNITSTDPRERATFAGAAVSPSTELRNAAPATASVATASSLVSLPAGATTLPGTDNLGDRGIFGPFRGLADLGGKNQAAIGVQNSGTAFNASMDGFALRATLDPLSTPGPYAGQYSYYGLNTWTPLLTFVYNFADVGWLRTIDIAATFTSTPTGFRFDSAGNQLLNSSGENSWPIDLDRPIPVIRFPIPAPGAAAVLVIGAAIAIRRRRD